MSFNLQDNSGLSGCFSKAGLTIATTTSAYRIVNATPYAINGKLYSKAATDNIAFSAWSGSLTNLSAGQACALLVLLDSAGTAKVAQGDIRAAGEACPLPTVPNGYAVIGAIKIVANTAAFTFGTTALNASGISTTYTDLASHPGEAL
jgi:hypothetical protein